MRHSCVRGLLYRRIARSTLYGSKRGYHDGLSATPLSIWYARRLATAKEPLVELAGMSELRQRRSVLASSPRKGETQPSR